MEKVELSVTLGDVTAFFGDKSPLSNLQTCYFQVDGKIFSSVEQFIQAQKAKLYGNDILVSQIMATDNPLVATGQSIVTHSRWRENSLSVVRTGLRAKFSQNIHLLNFLLGCTAQTLVHASRDHGNAVK